MNKNNVQLIGWYGGDKAIARAAWTSTSTDVEAKTPEQIQKLIVNTLWNNDSGKPHKTPFERGIVEFNITCDQASHIHLLKHRTANINGESARYKELKEDRFLLPTDWSGLEFIPDNLSSYTQETFRGYETWKQVLERYSELGNELYHESLIQISPILGRKRTKESARFFKTMNSQLTLSVMMNMSCFHNFYTLRADEAAQKEIREIANLMIEAVANIEGNPFKYTLEAFGYEPVVEEVEVVPNPIWRVRCNKGFNYKGKDTLSIRTHEYKKAVEEGYYIELIGMEKGITLTLSPEQVANEVVFVSKTFKGNDGTEYQLYNYYVD